jgi:nucleoside-diphosphate-sugar epimerase
VKKIFVTGHRGYIGTHLVELLKEAGFWVEGCDLHLFEGCEWEPSVKPDRERLINLRAIAAEDLEGFDCIMHLAAISNDPMGDLDPEITYSINREGTISLAQAAKDAGVPLFLFASSCSIYGKGASLDIDETQATAPLTPYAASKIEAEKALGVLSSATFKTVSLRNATAYGHSPMMRIDLVVNNLIASALAKGEIRVMSDGSPWRPLIHCRDIARAFVAFLNSPPEDPAWVVNVGSNYENYQVKEIVEKIHHRLPHTPVVFTGEVGADPRNYRVNFDLLGKVLPYFKLNYTLESGIDQLLEKYRQHGFSLADFEGDRFVRLRTLKKQMEKLQYAVC